MRLETLFRAVAVSPVSAGELALYAGTGDPVAFNNDAELLAKGRYACYMRDANELVGYEADPSIKAPIAV